MSIAKLSKVTLLGHVDDKTRILSELQKLGCLELIPLRPAGEGHAAEGASAEARETLRFLLAAPRKRRQTTAATDFDPIEVERRALECRTRLRDLCDRRDVLAKRITDLRPWGHFDLSPMSRLPRLRFWFYAVPHYQLREVSTHQTCWEVVNRDHRISYVVVISEGEPENMPVHRTHTGAVPLHALEQELEQVESAIEDAELERYRLTRWGLLLGRNIGRLEDRRALDQAAKEALDEQPLFGVQAWTPTARLPELEAYARDAGAWLSAEDPSPDETPPTLMENPKLFEGGQDLVNFYMIPGYWTWDPSIIVLFSFALFFAMILSDAGYGAVLGLIAWRYWKPMGASETGRRLRVVFALATGASLAYGVLTGGYFGIDVAAGSWPARIKLLDVHQHQTMMQLCVAVGAAHVMLSNLANAWRLRRSPAALVPLGWLLIVGGTLTLSFAWPGGHLFALRAGTATAAAGALLVLLFAAPDAGPLMRLPQGLLALLSRLSGAFGDVMSYLRLFALGLASVSLAEVFNHMALQAKHAMPGTGLLAFVLVLLLGHALNFVLGVMGAVVHSLRLNYIEFFNWSLADEGRSFKPFKLKGDNSWTL